MEKAETVLGRISAQADAASANVEEESIVADQNDIGGGQNDNIVDEDGRGRDLFSKNLLGC